MKNKNKVIIGILVFTFTIITAIVFSMLLIRHGNVNEPNNELNVYNETSENKENENKIEDIPNNEEINEFVVSFNTNGGTSISKQLVKEGQKIAKPKDPKKSGYTFKGWFLNEVKYDFNTIVTSDVELNAKWEKTKVKVTFNSNGGSSVSSQTINSGAKVKKPEKPTKEGYVFVEWTLNGTTYNFNKAVTKNITLVAKWKKKELATPKISGRNKGLQNGKFIYDLSINTNTYCTDIAKCESTEFEIYEKTGGQYTLVESKKMGSTVTVKVEAGTAKTYVARVSVLNSKGEKEYSKYSNEYKIDRIKPSKPKLSGKVAYYQNGSFYYDLSIDATQYQIASGKYEISGVEIYGVVGDNRYSSGFTIKPTGKLTVGVLASDSKSYAARVYVINSEGKKIYSDFSNQYKIH